MIRSYTAICILAFGILITSSCYPEDSFDRQSISIEGRISAIDTFKSTINVKSLIQYPVIKYEEINLFVGPNTKITGRDNPINIFDLVMGNLVNVKYYNKEDISEALLITVIK